MASVTSGSFTTGGYDGRCATFSWWVNSKSIVNNTTTIGWKLVGSGGISNYYYFADNFKVVIDGSTVYNSSDEIELWSGTTIASGTKVISHSADGSKTFSASVSCRIYDWTVTRTGSGSWSLPNIERSSTLSVTLSSLGTEHSLTINRQNSSFTHSLTWKCGSQNGTLLTKSSSTSVKFTPSIGLSSENKTGTSVWIDFTLTTYSGSATVGSTIKSGYLSIPSSVKPTCTVTVEDPTGYLATYGGYVKSKSKFNVTVTGTGSYGSSITGYNISANGSNYNRSSATTGVISSVDNNSITAKVTDSRNRTSNVVSKTVTILNYSSPSVTVNVERGDYDSSTGTFSSNISGMYCRAICKCTMTTLNSKNSGTIVLKYKKNSDSTWSSQQQAFTSATLNHTFIFAADDSYSYNVLATVSDNFESRSVTTVLSTGFAIMHVNASGKGIAFGKISEGDKFEVGMPSEFKSSMKIEGSLQVGGDGEQHVLSFPGGDHNTFIYGGQANDDTALGVWDGRNIRYVALYQDADKRLVFGPDMIDVGGDGGEHKLRFLTGDTTGKAHNVGIYGGNSADNIALGVYDWIKNRLVIGYDDQNNLLRLGTGTQKVSINDNLVTEVIVEKQETTLSNKWNYRKYSDGSCDLWAYVTISTLNISTQMGSLYRSEAQTLAAYPFSLTHWLPTASFVPGDAGYSALPWALSGGDAASPPRYYLIRASSQSSVNGKLIISVHGRWR